MRSIVAAIFLACASQVSTADLGMLVSRPVLYTLRLPAQVASWYHIPGGITASGAAYGGNGVAHRTLAFGSVRRLCRTDRPLICAQVRVVDRGPFVDGRDWDLPREVARKLHMERAGLLAVRVTGE